MNMSLEEILKERSKILDELIPELFKAGIERKDLELVCIHQKLAMNPSKINSAKTIKVEDKIEELMERFQVPLEIINKKEDVFECPLSCSIIENKWVGECGHVFEEKIVLRFLEKEKYCPVHGCNKLLIKKHSRM